MTTVWIAEHDGWPDERYIVGVFASVDRAVAGVKAEYPEPYRVRWNDPVPEDDGSLRLSAHFERVLDYSTKHDAEWVIHEEPVR